MAGSKIYPSGEMTGLANFIVKDLFDEWRRHRKAASETRWQENLDAFNSVSNGTWKAKEGEKWRSNTFVPITKMKVDAAYSMVVDMMLQGGRVPFSLIPSPLDGVILDALEAGERDQIEARIQEAQDLIDQQFADCHADRAVMKCVLSGAVYGEYVAKRYSHDVSKRAYEQISYAPGGMPDPEGQFTRYEPYTATKAQPAWGYVSIWNLFFDPESSDTEDGMGVIEQDLVSPYTLRGFKGQPYFIDEAIDRAIRTADEPGAQSGESDTASLPPYMRGISHRRKTIRLLEFWGRAPARLVADFEDRIGKDPSEVEPELEVPNDGDEVEIMAMIADDEIIRFARLEPDDERPYFRGLWEDNLDNNDGRGIADAVKPFQKVINGMARLFEDNKKLSANVILAGIRRLLPDWDGEIVPGKFLDIAEEADNASAAVTQFTVADVGETLLNGIGLYERWATDASRVAKVLEGSTFDKNKPDTATEFNILQQNAGKYIGGVIKGFDEFLIEPVVNSFHEYNMMDPEVTVGKGNFIAQAIGFATFQDRVVKVQRLMQFIGLVLQGEVLQAEVKFPDVLKEIAKSLDMDPKQVLKSIQEKKEEEQNRMNMEAEAFRNAQRAAAEERQAEEEAKEQDHRRSMEAKDKDLENDMIRKATG